jgi:glycerophosphoryl diester phosphodiesterase
MKIIGHRGARHVAPENTVAALKHALKAGVDEIEIDVRVTKDGHVVLHHNPVLLIDGKNYATNAHSLEELRSFKADLTTLAEAIRTVNKKVPLMIEVKPGEPIQPIVSVVEGFLADGWQPSDFMFGSFSQASLRQLRDSIPQIDLVVIGFFSSLNSMRRARAVGARKISLNHKALWFANIAAMRRGRFEVYAWTINNPRKAQRLARYGLSGAITDDARLYSS